MKIDKLLVLNLALGSGGVCASTEWEETLDALVWPDMTPECLDAEATPACSMRGAYFKGGVVSAADDDGTLKKTYRLRRKFTLKAKPTAAWLQGICDGTDKVVLNGTPLRFSRYIFELLLENRTTLHVVTDKLREGENEIEADYSVDRLARGGCNKLPAGVLLELFIRLSDGTSVRVDSDAAFESSSDGTRKASRASRRRRPGSPSRSSRAPGSLTRSSSRRSSASPAPTSTASRAIPWRRTTRSSPCMRASPGRKTVYLPRKADVVDVFNHRLVARDTDVFSFDADLHDTALFYYGPDAEELLLKLR